MAKNLSGELHVASANRLADGVVVFLDDAGQWTPRLDRAALARDERGAEILLERAGAEAMSLLRPASAPWYGAAHALIVAQALPPAAPSLR